MRIFRRIKLSITELERIRAEFDDYIWIAMDIHRGIISAGDCYMGELRDALLQKRSHPEHIYCIGLDMSTGEINYLKSFNRRNPAVGYSGEISEDAENMISRQIDYFFGALPAITKKRQERDYEVKHIMPMLRTARI